MKLIFAQYLASLKERGELDVIMPDLLSESGMNVVSRPARGTRQYGVDVAAVGPHRDGNRALFLLSIKAGDLRRADWDGGPQALRPSLNEIRDAYIRQNVEDEHAELPIVIVLCVGGDLHEEVRSNVVGFMEQGATDRISFELWNGDRLADLLLTGILRENALPPTGRSDLRKSIALVDEPDVSFAHFCRFVNGVANRGESTPAARLTAIRQMYLGLWTLYVWARDTGNIEAPYLCSERAVLMGWNLVKAHLTGKSSTARQFNESLDRLLLLHKKVAGDFITRHVAPRANTRHGLAASVPSHAALDINLKLFDVLGRTAIYGLWQLYWHDRYETEGTEDEAANALAEMRRSAVLIRDMLRNNSALYTPIKDNHAIDINAACLFLNRVSCDDIVRSWIGQTACATIFAYVINGPYPCVFTDYRDLVDHPKDADGYRHDATSGSLLIPTLAVWAALTDDTVTLDVLADFVSGEYQHSTLQLWFPGGDSEEHFYRGSADHGLAFFGFTIERACAAMLAPIEAECVASNAFWTLSAQQHGLWPLLMMASRHHRMPVPPQLWPIP